MPPHDPTIPDAVRRFVLMSVPSVPFLEAARLFHLQPAVPQSAQSLASALYVSPAAAERLLADLVAAGIVRLEGGNHRYAPRDAELAAALAEVFVCYQHNLVGITNLIHDSTQRSATQFANAFRIRKDT